MEPAEALLQANWNPFGVAEPSEDSNVVAQLLSTHSISREPGHDPSLGFPPLLWSDHGAETSYCSDNVQSSLYYWPQDCNSGPSNGALPPADLESHYLSQPNAFGAMGFCNVSSLLVPPEHPLEEPAAANEGTSREEFADSSPANPTGPSFFLTSDKSSPKRKSQVAELGKHHVHRQEADLAPGPRKKLRSVQKNGKNEQPKKAQKDVKNGDEGDGNVGLNGQVSSSCSSEEESSSSQEANGEGESSGPRGSAASNQKGKTRAGRGSATDPQSLYARKRRERINERLRILQNLVPNGTKVDISTMLEEAVQYVKFLQLQIKLLSSDDLWMYAPIAYNGMDIGLVLNNSPLH